jgi:tRNA (guanine37-N1)-methyltransferase
MKIDILSIFPEMFDGFLNTSIIKRAREKGIVEINVIDFRKYSKDPHHKVDDYGFGGGQGMVLMPQPIFDAVNDLKDDDTTIILMTPQGKTYNQKVAEELSLKKHLIIICGHYEGFDERIRTLADMEISIGDFVLTGGELPSMVVTDSVTRLLKGAITEESHIKESFADNLLDYPVYTHPPIYNGLKVPDVLLSGDHKKIDEWRRAEQIKRTEERRPDLIEKS